MCNTWDSEFLDLVQISDDEQRGFPLLIGSNPQQNKFIYLVN